MSEVPASMPAAGPGALIIARPSRDYRWRRYILALVMFGYGLYSAYDGFHRYPIANQNARNQGLEILPYPGYDVPFNQAFGVGLPPLSLLFLIYVVFYASRGRYEFNGVTLKAPGHGEVPVKSIRKIDRTKWDRKGIAYIHYQVPGNAKLRVLTLDDFIYDRKPTDAIYTRISEVLDPAKKAAVLSASPGRIVCPHCGVQNLSTALTCTSCGGTLGSVG